MLFAEVDLRLAIDNARRNLLGIEYDEQQNFANFAVRRGQKVNLALSSRWVRMCQMQSTEDEAKRAYWSMRSKLNSDSNAAVGLLWNTVLQFITKTLFYMKKLNINYLIILQSYPLFAHNSYVHDTIVRDTPFPLALDYKAEF